MVVLQFYGEVCGCNVRGDRGREREEIRESEVSESNAKRP